MRTHGSRATGVLVAALGMTAGLLVAAPSAHAAPSWRSLPSGTTQQISGVDYKGTTIAYVTSAGQLGIGSSSGFFTVTNAPSGAIFTEVSLNPSGTRALAVGTGGDDGELYVYDGSTWAQADLSAATVAFRYSGNRCTATSPALAPQAVENVEFHDVAWASDTVGYVVGTQKNYPDYNRHTGYALKTTDGGLTWTDMQNRADGTCMVPSNDATGLLKNVYTTANPDWVWMMGAGGNWNSLYRSTNGLASLSDTGADPYGKRLAIDPTNNQRQSASTLGSGYTNWTHTTDMWTKYIYTGHNQGHDNTKTVQDLEASPNGWFYIAGDGGLIERTKNGTHAEALPAAGALRYHDWKSIAFASTSRAVVAGAGGVLAISSTVNQPLTSPKPGTPGTAPTLGTKPPVKGKGLVKKGKNKYVLRVKGRLRPPNGINRKQACKGQMKLTLKGKVKARQFRNVIKKKAKVKNSCKYAKKIVVKGTKAKKLAGVKKVKLVVKFQGNKVMAPVRTAYKVRLAR